MLTARQVRQERVGQLATPQQRAPSWRDLETGLNDGTAGRLLVLDVAEPGSVSGTPNTTGMIPEFRASC